MLTVLGLTLVGESLNDLARRITGCEVHETVPDTFLRTADQVVNIDVPVEELVERLHAGRILPPPHSPNGFARRSDLPLRPVRLSQRKIPSIRS